MKKCFIRILSGKLKNKKIYFLNFSSIRPSKSNVKDILFSWIYLYENTFYVLDLFSGSGGFSFEFFSRGLQKIIMLEKDYSSYKMILYNKLFLFKLNLNCNLILSDSLFWLNKFNFLNLSFIVFDPPYNFIFIKKYFTKLDHIIFLRRYFLIFVENNSNIILKKIPYNWFLIKKEICGKTFFCLFKKI